MHRLVLAIVVFVVVAGSAAAQGTGDLARRHRTPEGVFYSIEGRIKDVINRGVEKIHAEEVEELIIGPARLHAIGALGEKRGEHPNARKHESNADDPGKQNGLHDYENA